MLYTLPQKEFLYVLIFLAGTDICTQTWNAIAEAMKGDKFYWGRLLVGILSGPVAVTINGLFLVRHCVATLTAAAVKPQPVPKRDISVGAMRT